MLRKDPTDGFATIRRTRQSVEREYKARHHQHACVAAYCPDHRDPEVYGTRKAPNGTTFVGPFRLRTHTERRQRAAAAAAAAGGAQCSPCE